MSSDTHTGTATDLDTITHSEDIENPPHKGEVIFTGPDGVGDHRVTVMDSHQYVGGVTASPEATGDVKYMCRAPKTCPHAPAKNACVGEVGWGVAQYADYSLLKSGNQIQLKQFRQANEDRYTHRYQVPVYGEESSSTLSQKASQPSVVVIEDGAQGKEKSSNVSMLSSLTSMLSQNA